MVAIKALVHHDERKVPGWKEKHSETSEILQYDLENVKQECKVLVICTKLAKTCKRLIWFINTAAHSKCRCLDLLLVCFYFCLLFAVELS